jgi:hypothetical protein
MRVPSRSFSHRYFYKLTHFKFSDSDTIRPLRLRRVKSICSYLGISFLEREWKGGLYLRLVMSFVAKPVLVNWNPIQAQSSSSLKGGYIRVIISIQPKCLDNSTEDIMQIRFIDTKPHWPSRNSLRSCKAK